MKVAKILIQRELLGYWRKPALCIQPLLLFLFIVIIFPLALYEHAKNLHFFASTLTWFAALFAILLSLEGLWGSDGVDGSLDYFFLKPVSFVFLSMIKVFCHWLITGLPILILLPLVFLLYHVPFKYFYVYFFSFTLGTGCISLLGSMISSVLLYTKQGALLLPTILLPLFIPVTLLVNGMIQTYEAGMSIEAIFLLFLSLFILILTLSPCVSAYVLTFDA